MQKIKGKVLWFERGTSKYDGNPFYFFAVALMDNKGIEFSPEDMTQQHKLILKGEDARKCIRNALKKGLKIRGEEFISSEEELANVSVVVPIKPTVFEFVPSSSPKVTTKKNRATEYKYMDCSSWRFVDA